MAIQLFLVFGALLAILWLIGRKQQQLTFSILSAGFIIKIIAGILFLNIYTHHYGNGTLSADAEQFMREGKVLNEVYDQSKGDYFRLLFGFTDIRELGHKYLKATHHWDTNSQLLFNDNRNLMRVHSLIYFISKGSLYVHMVIFSFISLLSIFLITNALKRYIHIKERYLFFILLLIPSVLFWSSSVLKEPILFLGIGLFLYGISGAQSWKSKFPYLLSGIALVLMFKPYILLCLLPAVYIAWSYKKLALKGFLLQLISLILIFITLVTTTPQGSKLTHKLSRKQFDFMNISQGGMHLLGDSCFYYVAPEDVKSVKVEGDTALLSTNLYVEQFDYSYNYAPKTIELNRQKKYRIFFHRERSKSYISVTPIKDNPIQLILNIPESIINVLFRPFITDSGSWLILPAVIETLLIWIFIFSGLRFAKRTNKTERTLIVGLITFILLLSVLIGWVTPVLGAINRYRIPVIMALVIVGLILWSKRKKIEV